MGKFLDGVVGQTAPRSAADQDEILGGDALDMHLAKRDALKSDQQHLLINSSTKFSTGPKSTFTAFPTKTDDTREAP